MDKIVRDVRVERYYPPAVAPSAEFRALAQVENPEYRVLWEALWRRFANTFVYAIDADGAARWEGMLRMIRGDGLPIETRRQRILAKINTRIPYTERSFQRMLDGAFGLGEAVAKCNYAAYSMQIQLLSMEPVLIRRVHFFARGIIPANLEIELHWARENAEELYYAAAPSIHTTYEIRPAEITDATAEARRYIGAAVSTHTAYEVYPDTVQDAAIGSTLYADGIGSIYKSIEVSQT